MSDRDTPTPTPRITAIRPRPTPDQFLERHGGALLALCGRAGAHGLAQELAAALGQTIAQVVAGARQELAARRGGPDGR
jgi:hypothetical protein